MVLLLLGGGVRRRGGGLLGGQGLLRRAVLPRPPALPLGRLQRRRHRGGGDGVRVDHVGSAIAGVAARQQAVGRRDASAGGGALVVVVVVVGAELVFIGFHSS